MQEVDLDHAVAVGRSFIENVERMVADHEAQSACHRVREIVANCAESIVLHELIVPRPTFAFQSDTLGSGFADADLSPLVSPAAPAEKVA